MTIAERIRARNSASYSDIIFARQMFEEKQRQYVKDRIARIKSSMEYDLRRTGKANFQITTTGIINNSNGNFVMDVTLYPDVMADIEDLIAWCESEGLEARLGTSFSFLGQVVLHVAVPME